MRTVYFDFTNVKIQRLDQIFHTGLNMTRTTLGKVNWTHLQSRLFRAAGLLCMFPLEASPYPVFHNTNTVWHCKTLWEQLSITHGGGPATTFLFGLLPDSRHLVGEKEQWAFWPFTHCVHLSQHRPPCKEQRLPGVHHDQVKVGPPWAPLTSDLVVFQKVLHHSLKMDKLLAHIHTYIYMVLF